MDVSYDTLLEIYEFEIIISVNLSGYVIDYYFEAESSDDLETFQVTMNDYKFLKEMDEHIVSFLKRNRLRIITGDVPVDYY